MKKLVALVCQASGLGSAGYGLYMLAGLSWTLLAVGLLVTGIGVLLEAGRL